MKTNMYKKLLLLASGSIVFANFWSCAGSNNLVKSLDMFLGIATGTLLSGVI